MVMMTLTDGGYRVLEISVGVQTVYSTRFRCGVFYRAKFRRWRREGGLRRHTGFVADSVPGSAYAIKWKDSCRAVFVKELNCLLYHNAPQQLQSKGRRLNSGMRPTRIDNPAYVACAVKVSFCAPDGNSPEQPDLQVRA